MTSPVDDGPRALVARGAVAVHTGRDEAGGVQLAARCLSGREPQTSGSGKRAGRPELTRVDPEALAAEVPWSAGGVPVAGGDVPVGREQPRPTRGEAPAASAYDRRGSATFEGDPCRSQTGCARGVPGGCVRCGVAWSAIRTFSETISRENRPGQPQANDS